MTGPQLTTFTDAINSFQTQLSDMDTKMNKFITKLNDTVKAEERLTLLQLIVFVAMICIAGSLIFFLVLMACSMAGWCYKLSVTLQAVLVLI